MAAFTFHKSERIKSKKQINDLFASGHRLQHGPLLLIWKIAEESNPSGLQFGISVPRRKFKRAVERNKIKRRLREVIRHEKVQLKSQLSENTGYALFIIYTGNTIPVYGELAVALEKLFKKWLSNDKLKNDQIKKSV